MALKSARLMFAHSYNRPQRLAAMLRKTPNAVRMRGWTLLSENNTQA